jgi:hypothetical protein
MDLRAYYEKIRMIEATIMEIFTLIVSLQTNDGGHAGIVTEVPRKIAAKMMVEGTARLANADEAKQFRKEQTKAIQLAEQKAAADKLHLTVIATSDLNRIKDEAQPHKD